MINNFLDVIQSVGVIAALVISIITIIDSNKSLVKNNKSRILTKKRSKRIDLLRKYSSEILAEAEIYVSNLQPDISKLVHSTYYYASVLQYNYQYKDDIKLIKMAHAIKKNVINEYDRETVRKLINDFYFLNDLYIATEFSRVASEIRSSHDEYASIEVQKKEAAKKKEEYLSDYIAALVQNDSIV